MKEDAAPPSGDTQTAGDAPLRPASGAGVTVVILTYNEELHLGRALESVAGFASQVFVVDSGSTDRTVEIAQSHGAQVLVHPFVNHARQFQWALDTAPIATDWVMRLDADEIVGEALSREIAARLPTLPADVAGVNLKRRHIFLGRWIRHGGRYPLVMLRIWRRGQGRIEDRWMDEHMVVQGGRTLCFDHDFSDHNLHDLTYFTRKHNDYATREAIEVLNHRLELFPHDTALNSASASRQASIKRQLKQRLYNRIPFTVSAPAYFLFRYIVQLGMLDGREGLIYHFLQGCWYRFLVGAKVLELERAIGHLEARQDILAELSRLTGLDLTRHPDSTP